VCWGRGARQGVAWSFSSGCDRDNHLWVSGKVSAGELVGVTRDLQMEGIRGHDARCNVVVVLETDIGA
jgi:hypothetical protein